MVEQLECFVRRMGDLTRKTQGVRRRADEVEKQMRDSVLEVCCEEQMGKLARQEARTIEEERARRETRVVEEEQARELRIRQGESERE